MKDKSKLITVLRWIGILPLSFVAMFLTNILIKILTNFDLNFGGFEDRSSFMYILFEYIKNDIIGNVVVCAVFVIVGYFIAPKFNLIVALILMIIGLCVVSVSMFIENFINNDYLGNIPLVASLFGFVIGYLFTIQKEKYEKDA